MRRRAAYDEGREAVGTWRGAVSAREVRDRRPVRTAAVVLEVQDGRARDGVNRRVALRDLVAHFMGEPWRQLGEPLHVEIKSLWMSIVRPANSR